ncbi:MAG: hypothetical protein Q8O37_13130 [Sulfuricellaceae bacterium]|nr:hypothetical protein [Sulfuricellaceae bacterium]
MFDLNRGEAGHYRGNKPARWLFQRLLRQEIVDLARPGGLAMPGRV